MLKAKIFSFFLLDLWLFCTFLLFLEKVMKKLLIATHNPGKFNLFKKHLSGTDYQLCSLRDLDITYDVPETGTTFEANAGLKAREYMQLSGLPTLADDGGIEVDALDGQPGVYSARYAGQDATDAQKVAFLLEKLQGVPLEKRTARFRVVLAFAQPGKDIKLFDGTMEGFISQEPRGKPQKGLPYRQIFIPAGYNKTFDELDEQGITDYISHRQKAVQAFLHYLHNEEK